MKEYLSIKDVADYLGVDYKTIYRLVQQAEIPAAKVGGVYRIPRQEVEAYYERQRQALVRQAADAAPIKCGRCLRLLAPYDMAGTCSAPGCEEPICRACWEADPDHRCRQHALSREDRLRLARAQLAQGTVPLVLESAEAYRREMLYLGRVEAKLRGLTAFPHPVTRRSNRISDWDAIESRVQDLERFRQALGVECDTAEPGPCPTNPRLTYRLAGDLLLEVAVYSDLATHLRRGFVTQPTTHTELFEQLSRAIDRAESQDSLILLCLAATTGWELQAVALVEGDDGGQRPFYHRRVAPVLVDLAGDRLAYNRTDERLDLAADLFSSKIRSDLVQELMDAAEAMFTAGRTGVLLSEIVEERHVEPAAVTEAFDRLAATRRYRVGIVDKRDRLLERRA